MSNVEKQRYVINEVLLYLEEELEGMGSSLEIFDLPSPNLELRIQRVLKCTKLHWPAYAGGR